MLLERLGVPDVAVDDLPALLLEFLCTLHDGSTDCVFCLEHLFTDLGRRDHHVLDFYSATVAQGAPIAWTGQSLE